MFTCAFRLAVIAAAVGQVVTNPIPAGDAVIGSAASDIPDEAGADSKPALLALLLPLINKSDSDTSPDAVQIICPRTCPASDRSGRPLDSNAGPFVTENSFKCRYFGAEICWYYGITGYRLSYQSHACPEQAEGDC